MQKKIFIILLFVILFLFHSPEVFAQEYYFNDEFSGASPDLNKWTVYENKGCPVAPSVEILKSGYIKLSQCINKPQFPYVVSKNNPFPNGDYSVEISFQYTKVTYWGTGIVLAQQAPENGGNFSTLLDLNVWQDKSQPDMRVSFDGNEVYTTSINTSPHILKVERIGLKYRIYLDNNLIFTSPDTTDQVKYIWMGNPLKFSPYIPEWTEFKVDYIRVTQLAPTKLPVIFIPGIGGSQLKANNDINWDNQDNGHGGKFSHNYPKDEKIWVNEDEAIKLGNDDYFDILRMKPDGLTSEADLGLTGNLTTQGYADIDPFFASLGYLKNTNFFIFTYDWRKDIRSNKDSLDALISTAKDKNGTSKVNLVAHSMGGLVARYYISDAQKSKNVNKLITLGTPYLGSVEGLKSVMYGSSLGKPIFKIFNIGIPGSEVKDIFQNLPSAFQLLPSPQYYSFYNNIDKDNPLPFYDDRDIDQNNEKGQLNFNQLKTLLQNLALNMTVFDMAEQFHNFLDPILNKNNGLKLYNIVGSGQPTLGQLKETWWITWPIKLFSKYDETFINGDDTIPLYSASLKNSSLDLSAGANTYYIEQKHSDLVNQNGAAMQTVKSILEEGDSLPVEVKSEKIYLEGKHISVDQDADLDLYDDLGNHTGIKDDRVEATIPETFYDTLGNTKHAFVKSKSKKVTVKVTPKKTSSSTSAKVNVKINSYREDKITKTSLYQNISANINNTKPTLTFTMDPKTDTSPILIMKDNENTAGETITASAEISGASVIDATPPVTKIDFNGPTLTLTPIDDDSGILQTEYSLDNGQTVHNYTQPITINTPGSYTIQVTSTDKLGNQELPQTFNFTISQPSPTPSPTTISITSASVIANSSEQAQAETQTNRHSELARLAESKRVSESSIIGLIPKILNAVFKKPVQNAEALETKQEAVLGKNTSNTNNETIVAMNQKSVLWNFLKIPAGILGISTLALSLTFIQPSIKFKKLL